MLVKATQRSTISHDQRGSRGHTHPRLRTAVSGLVTANALEASVCSTWSRPCCRRIPVPTNIQAKRPGAYISRRNSDWDRRPTDKGFISPNLFGELFVGDQALQRNGLENFPLDEQSRGSKLYEHHHRAHEVLNWLLDGLEDVLCGGSHCNLMIKGSATCFPDALSRIPEFFHQRI